MGQIQLTISLVLIALFSIAVMGFAINFASDNNSPIDIADDPELSSLNTNAQGNVSGFRSNAESQYQSILETTIAPGSQTAQSAGPFAVTPANAFGATKNIIEVGYSKIFGSGSGFEVFFFAFISVILFMLGLFLYKTLRGFPD